MLTAITKMLARFRRENRGSILVETAGAIPIVVLLAMGGAEFARYVLLHQKLDRVAASVGDLIAQQETINEQQLADIFSSIDDVLAPFDLGTEGVVIVSSSAIPTGGVDCDTAEILWQRTAGTYSASSQVGSAGGSATYPSVPGGFCVRVGETVISSEMFYQYTPFFWNDLIGTSQIYKFAVFRPRLSKLDTVLP